MPRRRPPRQRRRAAAFVRPLTRHVRRRRPGPLPGETPGAVPLRIVTGSPLDRPLYLLLNTEGALCAGRVWQGNCILLFTSQAAAAAFTDMCSVEARPPFVFSRSRSEFRTQARQALDLGFVGGLIDPTPGTREAAFVEFDEDGQEAGAGNESAR